MVNIFGSDPLLGSQSYLSDARLAEIERAQKALEERKQIMIQAKQDMQAQQTQQQPAPNKTPIWDEIDRTMGDLSDKEFDILTSNEEFIESSNEVARIQNTFFLQMMRPIVEQSEEGRAALEKHLTLVKRLRKSATAEANKELADFKEYTEKYGNMPYNEYLKMKREPAKTPKKR